MKTKRPRDVQLLGIGKREDIAYMIDRNCTIFLFDIQRGCMQFLQYAVLEQIKNKVIISTKYRSGTKYLRKNAHVVVFCNEMPLDNALSRHRYDIVNL